MGNHQQPSGCHLSYRLVDLEASSWYQNNSVSYSKARLQNRNTEGIIHPNDLQTEFHHRVAEPGHILEITRQDSQIGLRNRDTVGNLIPKYMLSKYSTSLSHNRLTCRHRDIDYNPTPKYLKNSTETSGIDRIVWADFVILSVSCSYHVRANFRHLWRSCCKLFYYLMKVGMKFRHFVTLFILPIYPRNTWFLQVRALRTHLFSSTKFLTTWPIWFVQCPSKKTKWSLQETVQFVVPWIY